MPRELIPQLWAEAKSGDAKPKAAPAGKVVALGDLKLESKAQRNGLQIKLSGRALAEDEVEKITQAIAKILGLGPQISRNRGLLIANP